jgi:prefoldin subunit 5
MHSGDEIMEIETVDDLIRILQEHPEWRQRLRDALLTEEEQQTPDRLRQMQEVLQQLLESHRQAIARLDRLEESHQQAIARLDKLEESHQKLWESHQRLWESHQRLEESHQQLWESHRQAIARLDKLEESHQRLIEEVRELRQIVDGLVQWSVKVDDQLSKLRGEVMELKFHQRASAILGYYVRRPKVINVGDVLNKLREAGQTFTQKEWSNLTAIGTMVSARHPSTGEQIYIAVEVSCMIYRDDVERISERARMLTERGVPTFPMVAGEGMAPDVADVAERMGVLVLLDGGARVTTGTWLDIEVS